MGPGRRRPEELAIDPSSISYSFAFRRRTFLRKWCGVFFVLIAAGCEQGASLPTADQLTLTVAVPEATLDSGGTGIRQLAQSLSLEGLTLLGTDGRATPRLARSWTWQDNQTQLVLTLRDGVKLHDGSALTAAVVAEALSAAMERPQNQILYSSFPDVSTVRASGDLELTIELRRPNALLIEDLAIPLGVGPNALGTGAFRVATRESNAITLERFDDHHLGRTEIASVAIQSSPTLRTAWTSLLRGEVDMVTNVAPDAVAFVSNDNIQMLSFLRFYQFMVAFNSRTGPLRNPLVRRALNMAINREALVAGALYGQGRASTGPVWPLHWAYDRTVLPFAFDAEQAGATLDRAGLTLRNVGGRRIRFSFSCIIPEGFNLVERVALDVQKQLYQIGVDMQFDVVPIQDFDTRVREGRFEAVLIDMVSAPGLSQTQLFWRSAKTRTGLNVFGYENAEIERLFSLLSETTNEAAIRSATSRLQRVLLEDPPALFLAWTQGSRAVSRRFKVVDEPGRDPQYTIWRWTPDLEAAGANTD